MYALIQARMGSTRLPGKVLRQLASGQVILQRVIESIPEVITPVVLTTENAVDDVLVAYVESLGIQCFRGNELNVYQRYVDACNFLKIANDDYFFRVCSDNPLMDAESFLLLLEASKEEMPDYLAFSVNGHPSVLSHCGLYPELIRYGALTTPGPSLSFEHVTPHLYLDHFRTFYIESEIDKNIRFTVDDSQDLANVNYVLENITSYSLAEITQHSDLMNSMHNQILKHSKI
jgi:spore coat polysaccharide biosynthesis protein SpsF